MANQIIKCIQYDMLNTTAIKGRIYFCTDTRTLYKDTGNTKESRIRFNAVILHTDYERLNNIKPTIGRFYYVEETNQLWLFDTRWVLKVGITSTYNAYAVSNSNYYGGNYISPVVNTNESITGANGDKIIDNNGLMGDGSVAIRDINRIIRGSLKVDTAYQQLVFNSHLDNGFLFIHNSHLPYNDLSTSLGALHLTVDRDISDVNEKLDLTGQAYYYGTWNNHGDMNIISKSSNPSNITVDYTPNLNKTIVKLFFECSKTIMTESNEEQKIITHIVIRPISDTHAVANVISLNSSNKNTLVVNDIGELIYTNPGSLEENKLIDCSREISKENGYTKCIYTFDGYENEIKLVLKENENDRQITVPSIWSDSDKPDKFDISVWNKQKVLTEDMVEDILKNFIDKHKILTEDDINKLNILTKDNFNDIMN